MIRASPNGPAWRAAAVAAALACACGDEGATGHTVPVLSLTTTPASLGLTAGDSARIVVTAAGNVPNPLRLVWRSSHPTVVAVDSTGRVRALDAGAAVVSVEVAGSGGSWLSIPVTSLAPCALGVPVSGIAASTPLVIGLGATGKPLVVAGSCRPGADSTLVYESSDTTIVAIDRATGLPLGRREGQATVSVRLRAAPSVRVTVPVVVARFSCVFGPALTVQPSVMTLGAGDGARLAIDVAVAAGAPATARPVPILVSSDPTVATVAADGTVRAIGPGVAVVTVSVTTATGCGPVTQVVRVTVRGP